ncbi:acetyl-CoA carboxylase carboxyltransferase subunit alpha [Zavarzinia sp. CC-PAN008]|uniref:acetyl-CoA carboxylase carboxyltransferase subunit alpha n=1 Tax=Zavarzinia sp. CC-PAN008 TaxID=3243332 RepID=UPI003F742D28
MFTFLEFEKPIAELEAKLKELRTLSATDAGTMDDEIASLEAKAGALLTQTYAKLTPWQKTLVARHLNRPHFSDYVRRLVTDFVPLAGDRAFAEDRAIQGGPGWFRGRAIMLIGHEKGSDTEGRVRHNFGMAKPEGYRKAIRLMQMAERFRLPVVTLVDTQGAYPGIGAEERGQAEAIARSTQVSLGLTVPVVACIVGEGGSGGAVALATANRVLMLEHSVYSVISPEGCASILWRSSDKKEDAAAALKLTAQDLLRLHIIDQVVTEPMGGAHRAPDVAIDAVGDAVGRMLDDLAPLSPEALRADRRTKFLEIGRHGLA